MLIFVYPSNISWDTSTSWWHWGKSQRITKVSRIHPLGTMNVWPHFMAIHLMVVEMSDWTLDQNGGPAERHRHWPPLRHSTSFSEGKTISGGEKMRKPFYLWSCACQNLQVVSAVYLPRLQPKKDTVTLGKNLLSIYCKLLHLDFFL